MGKKEITQIDYDHQSTGLIVPRGFSKRGEVQACRPLMTICSTYLKQFYRVRKLRRPRLVALTYRAAACDPYKK